MSINPVTTTDLATDPTAAAIGARRPAVSPSRVAVPGPPNSGTAPRAETRPPQPATNSPGMAQDEVQVQRTDGVSGDIVIKYVDASGSLILQIPSEQVLGLARAVERAIEAQDNRRAGVAARAGGASDGN